MKSNILTTAEEITKNKKFSRLDQEFIVSIIERFLSKDAKTNRLFEEKEHSAFCRNRQYKLFLKKIKGFLHDIYAVYQLKDADKKEELFLQMKKCKENELLGIHKQILHCHTSSRERKDHYEKIYKKIFSICKCYKTIIDFGCGLNPFSIPFMKIKDFEYVACDFAKKDLKLIQDYFDFFSGKYKFNGKTILTDVFSKEFKFKSLPKADICFLFKMTDILDYFEKNHKGTARFLEEINADYIIVSFASKTVSGKRMNQPRRMWFERIIKNKGYNHEMFSIGNEIFYVISKNH